LVALLDGEKGFVEHGVDLRAGWRFLLFVLGIELDELYLRGPLLFPAFPSAGKTVEQ
jgi:hypothetical protein